MNAYSLYGDAKSLAGGNNRLCPSVRQNCCGTQDIKKIEEYWKKDTKHQGLYAMVVLLIYKYILGFSKQYKSIAAKIVKSYDDRMLMLSGKKSEAKRMTSTIQLDGSHVLTVNQFCYKQAKKMAKLDYGDRRKDQHLYFLLTRRSEFLQNVRRSFYCTLCSANLKPNIYSHVLLSQKIYHDRFYLSDQFCRSIYSQTFDSTLLIRDGLNPFVSSLLKTLQCVQKGQGQQDYANVDAQNLGQQQ